MDKLHQKYPNIVIPNAAQRIQAWQSLSPDGQQQTAKQIQEIIAKARMLNSSDSSMPRERTTSLSFTNVFGIQENRSASQQFVNANGTFDSPGSFGFFGNNGNSSVQPNCPNGANCVALDEDRDGLDDNLENHLADGFTPYYHISAGENFGTGFATFYDSVPETVFQTFGATPPRSYFRVKPLPFRYGRDGVLYGLIQLDYFTLWNQDDGLNLGSLCFAFAGDLGLSAEGLGSHYLDNEHSSVLVAAPVTSQNTYDPNVSSYYAYGVYSAAHEYTPFDHSFREFLPNPEPWGSHVILALTRSKHGTYPLTPDYNPDYQPLFQDGFILDTYYGIFLAYELGWLDPFQFAVALYIADTVFFACFVEHFSDQGGLYADSRTNVGEPNNAINGSNFINDTQLTYQLTSTLRPNW